MTLERSSGALFSAARFAFLLLLASLPWMKGGFTVRGLTAFPVDLLFVATFGLSAAAFVARPALFRLHPAFMLLAAYFVAMAVSAMFSDDPYLSGFKLLTQAYLLLLPVLAFNLVRTDADLRTAFKWWLVPAVAVGIYGLVTLFLFPFVGWHSFLLEPLHHFGTLPPGPYPRIELSFEYPAMLANYLGVSCMFLLVAASLGWVRHAAVAAMLVPLLASALFALTPGFGGIIAMLALWVWFRCRSTRPSLGSAAIAVAVGATVLEVLVSTVTPIIGPTAPFVIEMPGSLPPMAPAVRLLAWSDAAHNFLASPIVGHGIGVDAVRVLWQAPEGSAAGYVTDAHNVVLNMAAQSGILAVAAIGAIIGFVCAQAWRSASKARPNSLLFGLSIAWLSGFAIQGLVGSFEDARHLWVLFGLVVSVSRFGKDVAPRDDEPRALATGGGA